MSGVIEKKKKCTQSNFDVRSTDGRGVAEQNRVSLSGTALDLPQSYCCAVRAARGEKPSLLGMYSLGACDVQALF